MGLRAIVGTIGQVTLKAYAARQMTQLVKSGLIYFAHREILRVLLQKECTLEQLERQIGGVPILHLQNGLVALIEMGFVEARATSLSLYLTEQGLKYLCKYQKDLVVATTNQPVSAWVLVNT